MFKKELLLASTAILAVAAPVVIVRAQSQTTPASGPTFEVASIKPSDPSSRMIMLRNAPGGRFTANGITAKLLITQAYNVRDFQISGGPSWMDSARYDITATVAGSSDSSGDLRTMSEDQRNAFMEQQRLRLQALLADRFQLQFHRSTKELPVYALVIAKNGPKLQEVKDTDGSPTPGGPKGRGMRMGRGELTSQGTPMQFFVQALSQQLGRTVIDKTGLKGIYNFKLTWTPDPGQGGGMFRGPDGGPPPDAAPPPDTQGPSIFTALQEQLGLKLEAQKGPVEILMIDRIEKPTEN